jgi:membrane fusion protein (multidrug efflux system)
MLAEAFLTAVHAGGEPIAPKAIDLVTQHARRFFHARDGSSHPRNGAAARRPTRGSPDRLARWNRWHRSCSRPFRNQMQREVPVSFRHWLASIGLLSAVIGGGALLAGWKISALREAAAAPPFEPMETVAASVARAHSHRETTTAIGTIVALRSVTLRNELPGTVRDVHLAPGQVVDAGTVLVRLDTSVEEAELRAQEAQAALAETLFARTRQAREHNAVSDVDMDRAAAERDVALARIARTRAILARKTIRAPFRARVGMADVHPGQYLHEGTLITTLQGVDDAVHVEFHVPQRVAAGLRAGDRVEAGVLEATIVAVDARVDVETRNARIRARIAGGAPAPGASVRVRIPIGAPIHAVAIPVSALRRSPSGDHVFAISNDADGHARARLRPVDAGPMIGDEILIRSGLADGERVASTGSFKLRDGILVAVAGK